MITHRRSAAWLRRLIVGGTVLCAVAGTGLVATAGTQTARAQTAQTTADCGVLGDAAPPSTAARRAVEAGCAEYFKGTRYTWGGGHEDTTPGQTVGFPDGSEEAKNDANIWGFDCSGFVRWTWFVATGKDWLGGGTAHSMVSNPPNGSMTIDGDEGSGALRPGDIVFWDNNPLPWVNASHTGLYIGGGKVVEALQSGTPIQVGDIEAGRKTHWTAAIRMNSSLPERAARPTGGVVQTTWNKGVDPSVMYRTIPIDKFQTSAYGMQTYVMGKPLRVRVTCQTHSTNWTTRGITNDAWSYLPDYNSWIPNIYLVGPAWLAGVPDCGTFTGGAGPTPDGNVFRMWASQANIRTTPSTGAGIKTSLAGPVNVRISCQKRAGLVTTSGITNNAWSYLPDYGGWITNIFISGPEWLPGVPGCDGDNSTNATESFSTWGSNVNVRSEPSTAAAIKTTFAAPRQVRISCQKHAQQVTAEGHTNSAWSYLGDYGGWVSNIYIKGPAWLGGVPDCGGSTGPAPAAKCADNSTPNGTGATSPRTASIYGRTIELRYSATTECAWARISVGSVGDEVWLDRSFDNGKTWQPHLGYTRIASGRDVYTNQWNDHNLVMRACGKAGDRAEIACTGWF